MRYALISDIHANLPALEAVLADIECRPDIGALYHLGDLVGYAPWPDEVVALRTEVEQLRAAMASRAVIEQAKGILMLLTSCSDKVAFDLEKDELESFRAFYREYPAYFESIF